MEKIKLIVVGLFFIASCNSAEGTDSENSDSTEVVVKETFDVDTASTEVDENQELGAEYTSAYICPDHCKDSGSDKEGECPNCGMELLENPNY